MSDSYTLLWSKERCGQMRKHTRAGEATFGRWQQARPEFSFLAPTCTSEVALGEEGTPFGLMIAIPADVLEGLRFRSQRGERGVKHIVGGRLKSANSFLGGTYRLSEASARHFEAVLAGVHDQL